ncbi:MAG: heavy metal translocating P-type ATPase metal-binding domain-containing protein [Saprospiraceae bacterium]|nr:heavy metal translocating P-type ATPase metal-binding domain-containing protein [Saprospiraceae bacterium]
MFRRSEVQVQTKCYHCGDECLEVVLFEDKAFCCIGCKTVYGLLSSHELCEYYSLDSHPGFKTDSFIESRFKFLDRVDVAARLIHYSDNDNSHVRFLIPRMHCVSCLFLLENLHRFNSNILNSQVDFDKRKVSIIFNHNSISLREIVELLSKIGYEPYLSQDDLKTKDNKLFNRGLTLRLGVAGFCFANIMLLSFPEYLGLDISLDSDIAFTFRWLIFGLSLPVLLYSAQEFFYNSWIGLKNRYVNIDAPVSVAVLVTFVRSVIDIFSNHGPGFLDSMSGIVFFMLVGRYLQNKTKDSLDFDRDFNSNFPVSVNKLVNNAEYPVLLSEIKKDDVLQLRNFETIPVDGILVSESVDLDYSFITGESLPRNLKKGELVYQGGRVIHNSVQILALREFNKNSFVELWNTSFDEEKKMVRSVIHRLSQYFSLIVFSIAITTAIYWSATKPENIFNSVTSILIIACPCLLLLASSYTNGFLISLFSKYGFYFKNYTGIERLSECDQIVFDKTGTITSNSEMEVLYEGEPLSDYEKDLLVSVSSRSNHPFSKSIHQYLGSKKYLELDYFQEYTGLGLLAKCKEDVIKLGSRKFVENQTETNVLTHSEVYIKFNQSIKGKFIIQQKLRDGITDCILKLKVKGIHILSGDKEQSVKQLVSSIPRSVHYKSNCTPKDKLDFIKKLQSGGSKVVMLGDGLNDAGALKQADVGVSVLNGNFNFTPASDAILEGGQLNRFDKMLTLSKFGQKVIKAIFFYSFVYNIIGIFFAVTARLTPLISAVLMPISSLSIIFLSFLFLKVYEYKFLKDG